MENIENNKNSKFNIDVNANLTESEKSLKKKIFSLPKMEALVFSDPKLLAVYNEMAETGEEKYGYHYNETIMNIIFNEYVLNSLKYIQKYKMARPKKKKRRDISGINQLKQKYSQSINENYDNKKTKVVFLVHKSDNDSSNVLAYFPDEPYDNYGNYMGYSHITQYGAVSPEYAKKCRLATQDEYEDLKNELEQIGYNLDVVNTIDETTTSASSGSYSGNFSTQKKFSNDTNDNVDETVTSSSSGFYSTKYVWGKGDLIKGKDSPILRKPIWNGGKIIQESNYLIESDGFEKYYEQLDVDINSLYSTKNELIKLVDLLYKKTGRGLTEKHIPMLKGEALYIVAIALANKILPNDISFNDLPQINSLWEYIDVNGFMSYQKLIHNIENAINDRLSYIGLSLSDLGVRGVTKKDLSLYNIKSFDKIDEESKSKAQQRLFGIAYAAKMGKIPMNKLKGAAKKIAKSVSKNDIKDFASTKHDNIPEKINEFLSIYDTVEYVSDIYGEEPFVLNNVKWQYVNAKYPDGRIDIGVYRYDLDLVYDYKKWQNEMINNATDQLIQELINKNNVSETDKSIISRQESTMANRIDTNADMGQNVPRGTQNTKISENIEYNDFMKSVKNELNALTIHQKKLKNLMEDRKPSALILKDRLGNENKKNFKKDLSNSYTIQMINIENELQWKEQQTNIDNPQELSNDIEKNEIKNADMKSNKALKNVGNSDNKNGDEIPKRNLTDEEQNEVDLYRLGLHSLKYDNDVSDRFEERMKNDMGNDLYNLRKKQIQFRNQAPMYNKDNQPIENSRATKTNVDEMMITGKYTDKYGKNRLIDFTLNDVLVGNYAGDLYELNFTGLGNKYYNKTENYTVLINEEIDKTLNNNKFYTDGKLVYLIEDIEQNNNENKNNDNNISENYNKLKKLINYNPKNFIDTKKVKNNRGF